MSDESVRHPRSFEPPPWEREQFDELARARAEREAAEAAAPAAAVEAEPPVQAVAAQAVAAQAVPAATVVPQAAAAGEPRTVTSVVPLSAGTEPEPAAGGSESAQVDVMMLGLAAEEPKSFAHAWLVVLVSAGVFTTIGLAVLIVGVVGISRSQGSAMGTAWSFVLVLAGVCALGVAGWLLARALRERGA